MARSLLTGGKGPTVFKTPGLKSGAHVLLTRNTELAPHRNGCCLCGSPRRLGLFFHYCCPGESTQQIAHKVTAPVLYGHNSMPMPP
eukprot:18956-Heterococcus_DN1.PRE.1